MQQHIDPAQLGTPTGAGMIIAVVEHGTEHGTELAIADPDTDGAFALQLDRPAKEMLQMTRRAGRRRNIKVWRCYGHAQGRHAAVSILVGTPAVWAADSLQDWPVGALIGSAA